MKTKQVLARNPLGRRTAATAAMVAMVALTSSMATAGSVSAMTRHSGGRSAITLTVLDYWGGPPAGVEFPKLIKQYEAAYPNVHIQETSVPQPSFVSKVLEDAAGGNTPDVIIGDNPDVPDFTHTGILAPLTKLMPSTGLTTSDFYPGPMQAATWDGVVYGVPVGSNVELLYYNKALLAKAGVAVPRTWAQLSAAALKLTNKAKNIYGFGAGLYAGEENTWDWENYLWDVGGSLADLNSPAAAKALTWWTSFVKNGSSPAAEVTTSFDGEIPTLFAEGQLAMAETGSWNLSVVAGDAPKTHLSWGVTTLPTPSAGQSPVVPFGGEDFSVGKTDATHEAAAWAFIRWLFAPNRISSFANGLSYLTPLKAAVPAYLKAYPLYAPVATEMGHSESRTANLAYNYPQASQDIWTAIDEVLDGRLTVPAALKTMASDVTPLVVVK